MLHNKFLSATLLLIFSSSLFGQESKDVESVPREQKDRALVRELESLLGERGIDAINKELQQRARKQGSLERALIRCVQSDPDSGQLQFTRYLAARLLGEYKSVKAIPALLENLSWETLSVIDSVDRGLGSLSASYPCVRAVIEIGTPAEPLIIEHVLRTPRISDLEIELAAYCLLKIKCGEERIYDSLAESVREELKEQIRGVLNHGQGNIEGLTRLSDFAGKMELFVYEHPEAAKKRGFTLPTDSPYFRNHMHAEAKVDSEPESNDSPE